MAEGAGLALAKGQVLRTRELNRLLAQAVGTGAEETLSIATLRAMQQAVYAPANLGHFGLALANYAHFTSPIRRYADLVVHRALITAHGWGPDPKTDGLTPAEIERLEDTAEHVSMTERRSMAAERDTTDRYLAAFLSTQVGATFEGIVSGVQRFGLFVKLDGTGADGLIPVRGLGAEYWQHDGGTQTLTGTQSGQVFGMGQRMTVRLAEAVPETGGLILELIDAEGAPRTTRRAPPRGAAKGRRTTAAPRRKVTRTRR